MSVPVRPDQDVDLELVAAEVLEHHEKAQAAFATSVDEAILCGKALQRAKAAVKHGEWLPWLKVNFPAGVRTAQNYMRIADRLADPAGDAKRISHLGIGGVLRELAAPRPPPRRCWKTTRRTSLRCGARCGGTRRVPDR
jgi:hypothetical protein